MDSCVNPFSAFLLLLLNKGIFFYVGGGGGARSVLDQFHGPSNLVKVHNLAELINV